VDEDTGELFVLPPDPIALKLLHALVDAYPAALQVRVFDRNLHSRVPLDPTHVCLKRTCV
jgi:hypothetical protein